MGLWHRTIILFTSLIATGLLHWLKLSTVGSKYFGGRPLRGCHGFNWLWTSAAVERLVWFWGCHAVVIWNLGELRGTILNTWWPKGGIIVLLGPVRGTQEYSGALQGTKGYQAASRVTQGSIRLQKYFKGYLFLDEKRIFMSNLA